jgi:small subunit ribosomal protein S17
MEEKKVRKSFEGKVVSNKMQKSVLVVVERTFSHKMYDKIMKTSKKFMAHDEKGECSIGDRVMISEVRPLSKQKCWMVTKILEKAK